LNFLADPEEINNLKNFVQNVVKNFGQNAVKNFLLKMLLKMFFVKNVVKKFC